MNKILYLPIGLPGSGKTTLGLTFKKTKSSKYIDCDSLYKKGYKFDKIVDIICKQFYINKNISIYLDGLFITKEVQYKIISRIINLGVDIKVFYFTDSSDARKEYVKRDKLRTIKENREFNSKNIILKANVNFPNFKDYKIDIDIINSF
jgi:hypothetical protein